MIGWIYLVYLGDRRTLKIFNEQNGVVTGGVEPPLDVSGEEKGPVAVDSKEKDRISI